MSCLDVNETFSTVAFVIGFVYLFSCSVTYAHEHMSFVSLFSGRVLSVILTHNSQQYRSFAYTSLWTIDRSVFTEVRLRVSFPFQSRNTHYSVGVFQRSASLVCLCRKIIAEYDTQWAVSHHYCIVRSCNSWQLHSATPRRGLVGNCPPYPSFLPPHCLYRRFDNPQAFWKLFSNVIMYRSHSKQGTFTGGSFCGLMRVLQSHVQK